EELPEGLEPLGGFASGPAVVDTGPATSFFVTFGIIVVLAAVILARYYRNMTPERLELVKLLSSSVLPMATLIVVVLGAILFGLTTATESAALGAAGAFILALFARTLTWKKTKEAVFLTA